MTKAGPRLAEITSGNLDAALGIRVRPDQEHAVTPVVKSLAEAWVHPGVAWPRLIVDGDRPVGFLMAFLDIDWYEDGSVRRSGLWRLNIAAGEQGRGYGRFAVESVAPNCADAASKSSTSRGTRGPTARKASTWDSASARTGSPAETRRWGSWTWPSPSPARSAPAWSPSAASSPAAGVR